MALMPTFDDRIKMFFEDIVEKGENAGFFQQSCLPLKDKFHVLSNVEFVVCNCLQLREGVKNPNTIQSRLDYSVLFSHNLILLR